MIYKNAFENAKNGSQISLFTDGKPMFSKYNPERDSELFCKNLKSGFIVIGGIGSANHIEKAAEIFSDSRIIAFESDAESLNFSMQAKCIKKLQDSKNVSFCTIKDLPHFLQEYIPCLYKNFTLCFNTPWENFNPEVCKTAKDICTRFLEDTAADFSVQANFGKLWQRNIMISYNFSKKIKCHVPKTDTAEKTAAIIAAGPSLDKSIKKLTDSREKYYIIATDTGYGVLKRKKITADAVVSVDGQFVSKDHFYAEPKNDTAPLYFFDLTGNFSAIRNLKKSGKNVILTKNRHPLSTYIDSENIFPYMDTGSGTVTIAALDLAKKMGFHKIELFGADFCYSMGKPYARGTYLETNFISTQNRLANAETKYTNLMFRTELKDTEFKTSAQNAKTNSIMESYRNGLLKWCSDNCYKVESEGTLINTGDLKSDMNFYTSIKKQSESQVRTKNLNELYEKKVPLYPYMAYLQKNNPNISTDDSLKLAYKHCLEYNQEYEK